MAKLGPGHNQGGAHPMVHSGKPPKCCEQTGAPKEVLSQLGRMHSASSKDPAHGKSGGQTRRGTKAEE